MLKFNQKLRVCFTVCLLFSFQLLFAQQTWYVNANVGDDSYTGTSATDDGGGVGPFATIQTGLIFANDFDTLRVSDGE